MCWGLMGIGGTAALGALAALELETGLRRLDVHLFDAWSSKDQSETTTWQRD